MNGENTFSAGAVVDVPRLPRRARLPGAGGLSAEIKSRIAAAVAIREAEDFLADFADTYYLLDSQLQHAAVRMAVGHLVVVWLGNPLSAEIRLGIVAAAAGLPKSELRRQVRERAEFHRNFTEIHQRNPQQAEGLLCKLILA